MSRKRNRKQQAAREQEVKTGQHAQPEAVEEQAPKTASMLGVDALFWFIRVMLGVMVPGMLLLLAGLSLVPAIGSQLLLLSGIDSSTSFAEQVTYWLVPFCFFTLLLLAACVSFTKWFWAWIGVRMTACSEWLCGKIASRREKKSNAKSDKLEQKNEIKSES